tara:strand:+ start:6218 stop:7828 length:1611 start_codon:yes stop_codon:yes gene_type:complete
MAFNNFTVSVVSFNETAGVDWTIAKPSVSLIITPNTGYTVTAADFSPIAPLPTYVNSVVFTQNGAFVNCVITYIAPNIMPSADVLISLCIKGSAVERQICVAGVVSQCDVSNTKLPLAGGPDVPYVACGSIGSTSTVVASYQVTAESTYYYPTAPTLAVVIGDPNNYTITDVKSYDAAGNIIAVVFTVTYTFPLNDVIGDKICLTANAVVIYNPPVKITSYSFPTGESIQYNGQTTNFTINGVQGANWALNIVSNALATIINTSGTLDSTGTFIVPVTFPAVTVSATYTVTLTGDLASTFCTVAPYVPCLTGQPSVFTLNQYVNSTLSFAFTSTNSNITPGAASTITLLPLSNQPAPFNVTVTGSSTSILTVDSIPPSIDWTNQGLAGPVNWSFTVDSSSFTVDNSTVPTLITSNLVINVTSVGTSNSSSTLDLNQYVSDGGAWLATLCNGATQYYVSDADGWSGGTGQSQLGSLANVPYAVNNIVQIKDTATGAKLCVTITSFASGFTPTYYIDEGFQNQVSTFANCTICTNQNQ